MRIHNTATTGIGSLPFTEVAPALALAWSVAIPYLPELADEPMLTLAHRAWPLFLTEVGSRRPSRVKVQLAGPDVLGRLGKMADAEERVLCTALTWVRALRALGTLPILFLDEPALESMDAHPRLVKTLRAQGARVGLHCCGETDWERVMGELAPDLISFDVKLSLPSILSASGVNRYLEGGGRFSLGVIPTDGTSADVGEMKELARTRLDPDHATVFLTECLLTPACGLARRTVPEAEAVFAKLDRFRSDALKRRLEATP